MTNWYEKIFYYATNVNPATGLPYWEVERVSEAYTKGKITKQEYDTIVAAIPVTK